MAEREFKYMTAEELLETSIPDKRVELVRGKLIVSEPSGFRHGYVATRVAWELVNHVRPRGLGFVIGEVGFTLERNPDTVRGPDAAFISTARVPDPIPTGYIESAPDIVVEVLSPNDRRGAVREKIADWLRGGARLVWVIDPIRRRAVVHRADGTETILAEHDVLDGEDVLPGFTCKLADLLAP